jgi:hypothetical protein
MISDNAFDTEPVQQRCAFHHSNVRIERRADLEHSIEHTHRVIPEMRDGEREGIVRAAARIGECGILDPRLRLQFAAAPHRDGINV